MKPTFLTYSQPLLTVMLQCQTPETAIGRIRNSLHLGAEAFGLQVESLLPEFQTPETYARIFKEMKGRPIYVTYYRTGQNRGRSDEDLAQGLITLAESGATLCDVMGDLYSPHPLQLTEDPQAIEKQMQLIDTLHEKGAEVLMSSHVFKFTPAEQVLEMAREQKRRGADVIKLVTGAETMEQQLENLKTVDLLKRELDAPFVFLSSGKSSLLRKLGIHLGCCMCLCVYEHDALSTAAQPLLSTMKTIRDGIVF